MSPVCSGVDAGRCSIDKRVVEDYLKKLNTHYKNEEIILNNRIVGFIRNIENIAQSGG